MASAKTYKTTGENIYSRGTKKWSIFEALKKGSTRADIVKEFGAYGNSILESLRITELLTISGASPRATSSGGSEPAIKVTGYKKQVKGRRWASKSARRDRDTQGGITANKALKVIDMEEVDRLIAELDTIEDPLERIEGIRRLAFMVRHKSLEYDVFNSVIKRGNFLYELEFLLQERREEKRKEVL